MKVSDILNHISQLDKYSDMLEAAVRKTSKCNQDYDETVADAFRSVGFTPEELSYLSNMLTIDKCRLKDKLYNTNIDIYD